MQFIKDLLEKLSAPSSECVGVYISSDSKMEIIVFDKDIGLVKRAEKVDLKYDSVQRQIDLQEFESSLQSLITRLEIPPNYPYFLSLPNIFTSLKVLPSDLEDPEVEIALNSEAEKSYIFKKAEPKSSWNLIKFNDQDLTNTFLYSVLQKEHLENIQQVFVRNNLKLQAIDTSFAALIRGLAVSGILSQNIEKNQKWAIATISFNNYIIAKFSGGTLLNIIETPLALKSIDPDTLYQTISGAISEKLGIDALDNLYLVSQVQDFSAAKLGQYIKIICNIHTIDNNKFNDKPLFVSSVSTALEPICPESVGAACWNNAAININFNFSSITPQNEFQGLLGNIGVKKPLHLYLFIGIFGSLVFITLFSLIFAGINGYLESEINRKTSEIANLQKLDVPPPKVFNLDNALSRAYIGNLDLITSYDAVGATIPEKIWLKSFSINSNLDTRIKGIAYSVEDILVYFENMLKVAKFKNLRIKSIKVASLGESSGEAPDISKPEKGVALPLPPMPESEEVTPLSLANYYEFVFYDGQDQVVEEEKGEPQTQAKDALGSLKAILGK